MHRMIPKWPEYYKVKDIPKAKTHPPFAIYLYICVSVRKCQMSFHYGIWPTVFNLQNTSGQLYRITTKSHYVLQGQRYPIYVLRMSLSPKFLSASFICFKANDNFETNPLDDPKIPLKAIRSKIHLRCLTSVLSPNFLLTLLNGQLVWS